MAVFLSKRHKTAKSPRREAAAFTLVEVMVSLAILSIALVVLLASQTQSLNNVRKVANYERAVFITENQLHWTIIDLQEAESWQDLADLNGIDGSYNWRVVINEAQTESGANGDFSLLRIQAVTTWAEGRTDSEFFLETYYLWTTPQ